MYASGCSGGKKSGKQYSEIGNTVSGKKYLFLPAQSDFSCICVYVSVGAVPDFSDQYVYHRCPCVFPRAGTEQKQNQGTFPYKRISESAARSYYRCAGSRGAGYIRTHFPCRLYGYFYGGHHAACYCRLYDSL